MSGGSGPVRLTWRRAVVLAVASVSALAVVAVVFLAARTAEVVEEGALLSWTPRTVSRVELLNWFDLYVVDEPRRPLDVVNGFLLSALSGMALLTLAFLRLTAAAVRPRMQALFLTAWLGSGYLAFDELLVLHETIGSNLGWLRSLPGVERPDDVVYAAYVIPAAAFLLVFRRALFSSRGTSILFAAGIGLFLTAGIADVAGVFVDELAEPLASLCLLAAFALVALEQVFGLGQPVRKPGSSRMSAPGSASVQDVPVAPRRASDRVYADERT